MSHDDGNSWGQEARRHATLGICYRERLGVEKAFRATRGEFRKLSLDKIRNTVLVNANPVGHDRADEEARASRSDLSTDQSPQGQVNAKCSDFRGPDR
ncbi:hypothetical protein ColLi_09866 [Colletotrichum liriopes]|uniref:Uncharacterized protein n=1 Tax=Colletotrichum liriopes TaxID=708192 RepID=A0AA37LWY6_9PEZI|nr:hypothetical protein ColLi_09866 [Colletotrichum liriopes]